MVIVKKYGNRRLYDTSDSRYVTLAEIAAKIRAGEDVKVVDAKTGEELTAELLTQIIFEDPKTARLLPVPLLLQLIRLGDSALAEFFGRYVSWALEVYLQARQGLGALQLNPFAQAAFGGMNPLATILGSAARPTSPPRPPSTDDEVAALRREVEELKKSFRKPRR
jgi:polyhydroxyalkanoate synthesis repressor PhaR